MKRECDVLVIGGGPGGLAAACGAGKGGADKVVVLERDVRAGGILNQCIHDGFGLIRYHAALTGPEYACRAVREASEAGAEVLTGRHVDAVSADGEGEGRYRVSAYARNGIERYEAKTVILATGCRERTRGNISIPGSRPAGIFTAGTAQNLVNVRNVMIGKRVVVLGSGDIGLIMARRLTWEGAEVLAVAEMMPAPAGLARNVSQCVYEPGIPLYVNTTVSKIIGKGKLEAVELSAVDVRRQVIPGTERVIACDALVLSVGLIPENEVAETAGVRLKPDNSVETDVYLQTSVPGIFSCGNSRRVMDLADYVSEQGELAGRNAVHRLRGEAMETWDEEKTSCMKKGFPEEGTVTCTVCPKGCQVKWDEKAGRHVGHRCPRGAAFAGEERSSPKRTVTTTLKKKTAPQNASSLLPVRTAVPVPRGMVMPVLEKIKTLETGLRPDMGDVAAVPDMDGLEVPVIVTEGIQKVSQESVPE